MRPDLALQRQNNHVTTIGQFRLDHRGLLVEGEEPPDFEAWEMTGALFEQANAALRWWVGDWLIYGEGAYGERHAQALDATGWDYQTLANSRWVAHRIPYSRRREGLSWSHHAEVAALEEDEQEGLLAQALTDNLSVRELRALVRESQGKASREPGQRASRAEVVVSDPHLIAGGVLDLAAFTPGSVDVVIAQPPATGDDYLGLHNTHREFLRVVARALKVGGASLVLCEWRNVASLAFAAQEVGVLVATWAIVTLREGKRFPCLWLRNDPPVPNEEVPCVYWNPATLPGLYQVVLAEVLAPDELVAEVWTEGRDTAERVVGELGGRHWQPSRQEELPF